MVDTNPPATAATATIDSNSSAAPPLTLDALSARVDALGHQFEGVARQLEDAVAFLRGAGTLPDYRVVHALGECHRGFLAARHDLLALGSHHGVKVLHSQEMAGLPELQQFLETIRSHVGSAPATPKPHPETRVPVAVAPPVVEARRHAEPEVAVAEPELPTAEPPSEVVAETPDVAPELMSIPVEPGPTFEAAEPWTAPVEPEPEQQPEREPEPESVTTPTPSVSDDSATSARAILARANRLVARDIGSQAALEPYRAAVRYLEERLDASGDDPELAQLVSGEHPVVQLINAVDGTVELTDAQWADLHQVVSDSFGRPLAIALARQRLTIG